VPGELVARRSDLMRAAATEGWALSFPELGAATKRKATSRKTAPKRKPASRREVIDTGTNNLFVRRNHQGTSFKKVVDAGRSIAAD